MRKPRRIRISVFNEGILDRTLAPQIHHACKTRERAEKLFANYTAKMPACRIIMHEGNLRRCRFKILKDTRPEPRLVDEWTSRRTAFSTFEALVKADGGYYPSLNVAVHENLLLADSYDTAQTILGDPRRVLRWGVPFARLPQT